MEPVIQDIQRSPRVIIAATGGNTVGDIDI